MSDETVTKSPGRPPKKGEIVEKSPDRVFITNDISDEKLIQLDQDGAQLFFTDDVKERPPEVLDKLSKLTAIKYQQAVEIKKRLEKDDPSWREINKSLSISQSGYASPRDIAFGNKAKRGLVTRTVREDRVGYWEAKGYVMATPEHMVDAKMRRVEGHYEHGTIGSPKEYLMVTTEKRREELKKINEDRRTAIDASQVEDIKKKVHDSGIGTVDVD